MNRGMAGLASLGTVVRLQAECTQVCSFFVLHGGDFDLKSGLC